MTAKTGQGDFFSAPPQAPAPPAAPMAERPHAAGPPVLVLVDASGFIFRAFHAIPPMTTSKGVATNAVLGFARMVLKLLKDKQHTHVALAFDKDSRLGRLEIDPQYKANRSETPPDLKPQFELVRQVARVLSLPVVEVPGWEADDVIATLVGRARAEGLEVEVVTSDKDLLQLLQPGVRLFDPAKDKEITAEDALAKFGVPPEKMRDYQSLVGDAVDNVPKVPGVGPKTAAELLAKFGDLDTLLSRLEEVEKPKIREALKAHVDQIHRARRLVTFRTDLPITQTLASFVRTGPRLEEARALFTELEFHRLLADLPKAEAQGPAWPLATVVRDAAGLAAAVAALEAAPALAVVVDAVGEPHSSTPRALAISGGAAGCFYVDVAACGDGPVARGLGPLFSLPGRQLFTPDAKALWHGLASLHLAAPLAAVDVELFAFVLGNAARNHALAAQVRDRLGRELPAWPPPGKDAPTDDQRAAYFGAATHAVELLAPTLDQELEARQLAPIARGLDLALVPVLGRMEQRGIGLDVRALDEVTRQVDAACETLLADCYRHAGREFNVGSPPQLAQVLFQDLKLPVIKKNKTGPSTDHEVLEKLAEQHPLPRAIIEYRNVAKLKSTYLDTLPGLVGADGRIRTTFHQDAAATGRLSSTNPNLQNIPIRTELGRQIRRAFVAAPGHVLVSADYSQVELRILAHVAKDEGLLKAFAEGADVHARTAAEVFGVPEAEVTADQRRAAKMVNYGIAYGLSPHGLSARLTIPVEEAKSIIDRYFARFPGIARYIESTIEQGRKDGGVQSLLGRRRDLPDLNAKNRQLSQAAERAAINMPIQGTAADVMKKAMLELDRRLAAEGFRATMVLQVHDELLFEAPEAEAERVGALAAQVMSSVYPLAVPLLVDVGTGRSWADAH